MRAATRSDCDFGSFCAAIEAQSASTAHASTAHLCTPVPMHPCTRKLYWDVRVLGIDYGARRIGLALSDATATLASPWRLVQRPASEAGALRLMIKEITSLIDDDDGLEAVVIGWPRRLDGSPTDQTKQVEAFARAIEAQVAIPVVLQDERLSSHEAESRLAARESDWRKRKAKLDAAAAAIILQDYLDHRSSRPVVKEDRPL